MGLAVDDEYLEKHLPRRKTPKRLWRKILLVKREVASSEKRKIRERMPVIHGIFDTPFGKSLIGICEKGICHASFFGAGEKAVTGEFRRVWTNAKNGRDDAAVAETFGKILVPDDKNPPPVFLLGTPFQLAVWEKLLEVEEGETLSYSELAESVGRPKAVRAVANAVGDNPVGYLVPCHRIIGKAGDLRGYRWGVDVKKAMLEFEGAGADFT